MVQAFIQGNEGDWNVSTFFFLNLVHLIAPYSACRPHIELPLKHCLQNMALNTFSHLFLSQKTKAEKQQVSSCM